MASEAPANELSAAQKLMQKHAEAPHHVTVEDAPDEDLPIRSPAEASSSAEAPAPAPKAAPKQAAAKTLDTQSHELFPELGGPKGKAANVAPIWGAKTANGAASNGGSRSSTPASGAATPNKPSMSIPGRNVESITLDPQYILSRSQLKRPIPDIIKDLNRKSRATLSMNTTTNGRYKFDATGPQDVAQQAIKDLVGQIGTRVSLRVSYSRAKLILARLPSKFLFLSQPAPTLSVREDLRSRVSRRGQAPRFSFPKSTKATLSMRRMTMLPLM